MYSSNKRRIIDSEFLAKKIEIAKLSIEEAL
jgi:hypothetical protein